MIEEPLDEVAVEATGKTPEINASYVGTSIANAANDFEVRGSGYPVIMMLAGSMCATKNSRLQ